MIVSYEFPVAFVVEIPGNHAPMKVVNDHVYAESSVFHGKIKFVYDIITSPRFAGQDDFS